MKIIIFSIGMILAANCLYAQTAADYEKLKTEYNQVVSDRDNLRSQAQYLLQYKNDIVKAQEQLSRIETERKKWEIEKESFQNQLKRLQSELDLYRNKITDMQSYQLQLENEREEIKKSLSKTKSGYIIVDDLKAKVGERDKEISALNEKIKRLQEKTNAADNALAKAEANAEVFRQQVKELKGKYNKALTQNKVFEKKLEKQPREYAEIARENKILIKRTALMHYNLGVFYTKNKEHSRAISEFEKAIELNPEDAYAYFNLGYIYAEYYVDRPKAIECFIKYINLAKKDDKDIEWAKKYILTWQTWEGKEVLK